MLEATDLHCSVGIGDTLVRAKIATDFGKPQGTYQLTRDNWMDVMGERPTTALWGVGTRIGARLEAIGIRTVADLAGADEEALVAAFGPSSGAHLGRLGRGGGRTRPDDTPWVARAHGRETTYQVDLTTAEEVQAALRRPRRRGSSTTCARRTGRSSACTSRSASPRSSRSPRSASWASRRTTSDVIAQTAYDLFLALDDQRPVRLLGVRGEMVPPEGGY